MSKGQKTGGVEGLFPEDLPEEIPEKASAAKGLEDLFGIKAPPQPKFTQADRDNDFTGDYIKAPMMGLVDGVTMGYSRLNESKEGKKVKERSPWLYGAGQVGGAIVPGGLATKGVGALGKLKGLSSLARPGFRSGAVTGLVEGAVSDPGSEGDTDDRMARGGVGMLLGGGIGKTVKVIGDWGRRAKIFDKIEAATAPAKSAVNDPYAELPPSYSDELKAQVDDAVEKMMGRQVTPRKKELNRVLQDKTVKINPEFLKGFKREAALGAPRQKGGLDRLAGLLEKKAAKQAGWTNQSGPPPWKPGQQPSPQVEIPAKMGQRLKEYFDQNANYIKAKNFSDAPNINKGDRAYNVADRLRKKLAELDPKVSKLNSPMFESLRLKTNVNAAAEGGPLNLMKSKPSTDRGQLIGKLDSLSGSNLKGTSEDVREAINLGVTPESLFRPLQKMVELTKIAKRGLGKGGSSVIDKSPTGTRQALIQQLLDSMRNEPSSSEE